MMTFSPLLALTFAFISLGLMSAGNFMICIRDNVLC